SLTVVLAHYAASKKDYKAAMGYLAATTLLGVVFLVVKAYEYNSKFEHDILPGKIGELVPGVGLERERSMHSIGMQYVVRVRGQLEKIVSEGDAGSELVKECSALLEDMKGKATKEEYIAPLTPAQVGGRVNDILHKHHDHPPHISPAIP